MTLRDRLVFGTGRLAGGGYAKRSRAMIETCLNADIRNFDTAPSYGMGAAEALLGEVAGPLKGIAIHTKVGSLRPSLPLLRGWAKSARNLLPRARIQLEDALPIIPFAGPPSSNDYSPIAIAASLDRSRRLLRRDQLDLVLLHESEPELVPAETWALLKKLQSIGQIERLGFAHYGPPSNMAKDLVAQTAPQAADFLAAGTRANRVFHSLRQSLAQGQSSNSGLAARAKSVAANFGIAWASGAGSYLVAMLLLAEAWPDAQLIFATSRPENLAEFLALLDRVEGRN